MQSNFCGEINILYCHTHPMALLIFVLPSDSAINFYVYGWFTLFLCIPFVPLHTHLHNFALVFVVEHVIPILCCLKCVVPALIIVLSLGWSKLSLFNHCIYAPPPTLTLAVHALFYCSKMIFKER